MKKAMLKFANSLLSKEQMKNVAGGDYWEDYFTYHCNTCEGSGFRYHYQYRQYPSVTGGGNCLDWWIKTDSFGNQYWVNQPCGSPPYQ